MRYWTEEELNILKEHYPEKGSSIAGTLLDRSAKATLIKAFRLGVTCETFIRRHRSLWTKEETQILRRYYKVEGTQVAERLPDRTVDAVRRKAAECNLSYTYNCEHTTRNGVEGKTCTKCGDWGPLSNFAKDKQRVDKLTVRCRTCMSKYYRAHQGRYSIWRRKRHQEIPDSIRYRDTRERYAKSSRGRAARQAVIARRKLMENTGDLTLDQWERIVAQHTNCPYCGRLFDDGQYKLTIDHVVPLSQGGKHTKDNVLPVCFQCNREKSASLLGGEWLPWELYDEHGQFIRSS